MVARADLRVAMAKGRHREDSMDSHSMGRVRRQARASMVSRKGGTKVSNSTVGRQGTSDSQRSVEWDDVNNEQHTGGEGLGCRLGLS